MLQLHADSNRNLYTRKGQVYFLLDLVVFWYIVRAFAICQYVYCNIVNDIVLEYGECFTIKCKV